MCITYLISHTPCGHLTNSLPHSVAGHCKALDAALRYYHSQPDRPPLPGGMVMPSVCPPMRGEGSASRFWPVPWGCGRSDDVLCRKGWGVMHCPWTLGETQWARVTWRSESMAESGRVCADIDSNLRGNPIAGPALKPRPVLLSPYSNSTPTSRINLKNTSAKITNSTPPEAQFWGWGWWIDSRTGEISPPPPTAAEKTAVPLAATATRDKDSLGVEEPKVRMIWPGRCIVDGDVKVAYRRLDAVLVGKGS